MSEQNGDNPAVRAPLRYELTAVALAEMSAAGESVRAYSGDEVAELFSVRVSEAIVQEAERLGGEIAANITGKPFQTMDEEASVHWSQPVYRLRIETVRGRKRNTATGLWYLYYGLQDTKNTGKPDTMQVLALRHSASRPIGS